MRILLIENSRNDALLIEEEFIRAGRNAVFHLVSKKKEVETALDNASWDIIISEYDLGPFMALDILRWLERRRLDIPFLVVSRVITEELAVSVLKAGAHDFCVKSNLARLVPAAEREWRQALGRKERRRVEESLRLAQEALYQNESKLREAEELEAIGKLAGGIAHDFNNLMTAVIGFGNMALGWLDENHPVHGMLVEIIHAGERAAELTQQIRAFGQKQILAPRPLDLNEEVRQRSAFLSRIAGENVAIFLDLDPGLDQVCIDPLYFNQVLANLVSNSREAIPGEGSIFIKTSRIHLDGIRNSPFPPEIKGEFALLTVEDNGTGMEPAVALRVFEPYFTTKKAATRTGLGLGLAAVHGIVAQSGGHIAVESMKGQGSTFQICLPFSKSSQCLCSPRKNNRLPVSALPTILIADSEPLFRKFIKSVLEFRGYRILEAECGQSAIGVSLAHADIKLILLDSDTLGLPAQEFAIQCWLHFRTSRVIYMSSRSFNGRPHKCTAKILQKPFDSASLLKIIESELDSGSAAGARCAAACLK